MRIDTVIHRPRGFSLVEVMVALVVMSVGLLGIAKMQAVALSNTTVSSSRALAAIEAASLAASMHENRAYWNTTAPITPTISVQGTTVTNLPVNPAPTCLDVTTACTPIKLAAYELQQWANQLASLLPNDQVTITCTQTASAPVNCVIQITWSEKSVALNSQAQDQAMSVTNAGINDPTYELYVEP